MWRKPCFWLFPLWLLHLAVVNAELDLFCISIANTEIREGNSFWINDDLNSPNKEFCKNLLKDLPRSPFPQPASICSSKYTPVKFTERLMSINPKGLQLPGNPHESCVDPKTFDIPPEIRGVKLNDQFLRGWLSVSFTFLVSLRFLIFQVSDEHGNAIGEFLPEVEELCGSTNFRTGTVFPKKYQYVPCSAVDRQEPKVSQAVVYTAPVLLASFNGLKPEELVADRSALSFSYSIQVLWRLNEYYCNRHSKFRLVAYLFDEDKVSGQIYFGDWYHPTWFGAADTVPIGTKDLQCKVPITGSGGGSGLDRSWWVEKISTSDENIDRIGRLPEAEDDGLQTIYASCRTYLTRTIKYSEDASKQPSFGGRCELKAEKKFSPGFYGKHVVAEKRKNSSTSSVDVTHDCQINDYASYPLNIQNYRDYLETRWETWRQKFCNDKTTTCPSKREKDPNSKDKRMGGVAPATGVYIGRTRAYHGLTMTIAFLFFLPVSNFMARYFKETFLNVDIAGLRVWYVVHIGTAFYALAMIASAISASMKIVKVYGRSWDPLAQFHVSLGYVCLGLFLISIILGPFRPHQRTARLFMLVTHSALGFTVNLLGVAVIVSSTLIPGSPSASVCYNNDTLRDGYPLVAAFKHDISRVVLWWLGLEVFFHCGMTRLQQIADRSWNVRNRRYFPLVPVVSLNDKRSFKFFRYRTLALMMYVTAAIVLVVVIWTNLYFKEDWNECDAGPMTCTHSSNSLDDAYPEIICGRVAKIRAVRRKLNMN